MEHSHIPLVVDLDGTFLKTDILMEQIIAFVQKNPLNFLLVLFWFVQGFSKLKYEVFKRTNIEIHTLPINEEVVQLIRNAKKQGRKIILATASYTENALQVASIHNFFDEVLATTPDFNLRGKNKAKVLVNKFGEKKFDYIGDSDIDIEIWKYARIAYMVNPSSSIRKKVKKYTQSEILTEPNSSKIRLFFKAIRLNQWTKNLLLFAPAILAHETDLFVYVNLIVGFVAFSLLSSAVYLFNDLNDLNSDRLHPIKKFRPLASGTLHLETGLYLALTLISLSFVLNLVIFNIYFSLILFVYLLMNFLYSRYIKAIPVFDVLFLAIFYILRLYAGASISETPISEWLIMFSIFTFISLAILKRYSEILVSNEQTIKLRGYSSNDKTVLLIFGICLSIMSSVVFLFYTQSSKVYDLYSNPEYLIYIAPIIIFFYLRLWLSINQHPKSDNPLEIIFRDKVNYIFLILSIIFFVLAY